MRGSRGAFVEEIRQGLVTYSSFLDMNGRNESVRELLRASRDATAKRFRYRMPNLRSQAMLQDLTTNLPPVPPPASSRLSNALLAGSWLRGKAILVIPQTQQVPLQKYYSSLANAWAVDGCLRGGKSARRREEGRRSTDLVLDGGLKVLALAEVNSDNAILEVLSLDLVSLAGNL